MKMEIIYQIQNYKPGASNIYINGLFSIQIYHLATLVMRCLTQLILNLLYNLFNYHHGHEVPTKTIGRQWYNYRMPMEPSWQPFSQHPRHLIWLEGRPSRAVSGLVNKGFVVALMSAFGCQRIHSGRNEI